MLSSMVSTGVNFRPLAIFAPRSLLFHQLFSCSPNSPQPAGKSLRTTKRPATMLPSLGATSVSSQRRFQEYGAMCKGRMPIGVVGLASAALLGICLPAADAQNKSPGSQLGNISVPLPITLPEYGSGYIYGRPNSYYFITYGCRFYPLDKGDLKQAIAILHPKPVVKPVRRASPVVSSPSAQPTGAATAQPVAKTSTRMTGSAGACLGGY